jgi:predicted transcriptional regulator of viral defense system
MDTTASIRTVPKGITEKNRVRLAALQRRARGPFTTSEAAGFLALPNDRTQRFLAYLAARGWLLRVRRGMYAAVRTDELVTGSGREDPWVVAAKVFGPSCYIGGWTACSHWGLTEQVFREIVVFTTRKMRRSAIEYHGYPFIAKRISGSRIFGTRTVWRAQTKVPVSDPTRTIVDILDDPSIGGGIRHVADVLSAYLRSEHRNEAQLVDYAKRAGNRTVLKRLGYLLEALRVDAPRLLNACRRGMSTGTSLLDPSMPKKGRTVRSWKLQLNANVAAGEAD